MAQPPRPGEAVSKDDIGDIIGMTPFCLVMVAGLVLKLREWKNRGKENK
jgi:hypothetical protein